MSYGFAGFGVNDIALRWGTQKGINIWVNSDGTVWPAQISWLAAQSAVQAIPFPPPSILGR